MPTPLERVLARFDGSPTNLAAAMGGDVKRQNVEHWMKTGRVPPQHCPTLERLLRGAIPCESLRRDLEWVRVPDARWPWHPKGRPALDVARAS